MAKFDKKLYNRRYYLEYIKPFRVPRMSTPRLRYKCPFCGMRPASPMPFAAIHDIDLKLNVGVHTYYDIDELKGEEGVKEIYIGKLMDFSQMCALKCALMLRLFRNKGFITQDTIEAELGRLITYSSVPTNEAVASYSSISVGLPAYKQVGVVK